ncbi:hypothetical protein Tco_0311880 [Tanacetum coccineum]
MFILSLPHNIRPLAPPPDSGHHHSAAAGILFRRDFSGELQHSSSSPDLSYPPTYSRPRATPAASPLPAHHDYSTTIIILVFTPTSPRHQPPRPPPKGASGLVITAAGGGVVSVVDGVVDVGVKSGCDGGRLIIGGSGRKEWNSGDDQLRLRWMIYLVDLADVAESVRDTIGFEYCLASSSGWTK